jgi:hypothetical protein
MVVCLVWKIVTGLDDVDLSCCSVSNAWALLLSLVCVYFTVRGQAICGTKVGHAHASRCNTFLLNLLNICHFAQWFEVVQQGRLCSVFHLQVSCGEKPWSCMHYLKVSRICSEFSTQ